MGIKELSKFQGWKDLALEVAWKGGAGHGVAPNPAWDIDKSEIGDVGILWPTKYEWPDARNWMEGLITGFKKFVAVDGAPIEQKFPGIVMFQILIGGKSHNITIDYFDLSTINEACAKDSAVYFKMQYSRAGYPLRNVVPGGYVPDSRKLYLYLSSLRRVRDRREFDFDVYGRFSLDYAKDRRKQAIELLRDQNRFAFEGGLTKVGYVEFLKQISRAKICIDLPGNGDFCHRLVNYLAVGACVIGPRHGNEMQVPLVDRKHIAFTRDDMSDLIDLCVYYLENDDAREAMCLESRRYFDQNLHRDNLSRYYLRTILDHLAAS